jgi:hypothetical protein
MAYAEGLHMTQTCYFLGVLNRCKVFVNYPGPLRKLR